ncbi:hypothetical protein CRG98_012957, partial [Punica granatum]
MAMASSSPTPSSSTLTLTIFLFALLLSPLCFASSPPSRSQQGPRRFKKIYAFGDSFTDTGNTGNADGPAGFGHVSNPPYGTTFFRHPTNRYSDGRLVIDFVAESLSLPFLPPYRSISKGGDGSHGVDFAVAGSTAINHDFFVKNNLSLAITPQSILTQLVWFNQYLEDREGCREAASGGSCASAFKDALVWVGEIGVNDYAYTIASSVPWDTIQKLAVETVTAFLD